MHYACWCCCWYWSCCCCWCWLFVVVILVFLYNNFPSYPCSSFSSSILYSSGSSFCYCSCYCSCYCGRGCGCGCGGGGCCCCCWCWCCCCWCGRGRGRGRRGRGGRGRGPGGSGGRGRRGQRTAWTWTEEKGAQSSGAMVKQAMRMFKGPGKKGWSSSHRYQEGFAYPLIKRNPQRWRHDPCRSCRLEGDAQRGHGSIDQTFWCNSSWFTTPTAVSWGKIPMASSFETAGINHGRQPSPSSAHPCKCFIWSNHLKLFPENHFAWDGKGQWNCGTSTLHACNDNASVYRVVCTRDTWMPRKCLFTRGYQIQTCLWYPSFCWCGCIFQLNPMFSPQCWWYLVIKCNK